MFGKLILLEDRDYWSEVSMLKLIMGNTAVYFLIAHVTT